MGGCDAKCGKCLCVCITVFVFVLYLCISMMLSGQGSSQVGGCDAGKVANDRSWSAIGPLITIDCKTSLAKIAEDAQAVIISRQFEEILFYFNKLKKGEISFTHWPRLPRMLKL